MALKYALKLIFLKCIFEFMINTAPPTSNSIHGREKCFKYNDFNLPVPAKSLFLNFVHFFLFVFWSFFPFHLFPFILTADPLKLHKDFAITYF